MNSYQYALLASLAALMAPLAHADYLWLQREGPQAVVRAGELHRPLARLPDLTDPKPVSSEGKPALSHEQTEANFRFALGTGDTRFVATRASSDGVLTYFQARFGRLETKAVNDLELVPTQQGSNSFRLFFKGRLANASRVNVETAAGWRKSLTPNTDGTVTLDTPIPGLYVLEVSAKVNNATVNIEGKKYEDVRYTATLSFEVNP
ncbi:hypothetical protein [Ottowia thiooxydans]|uniref:hypothetical protein n=1 Tax=Ottowia thiooxydans TaxID=219182 RepID=UPI000409FCDF|nr:hypothetical protein [Ottowia thiooxydans]